MLYEVITRGKATLHQAFLPKGFLGALEENPFSLDIEKAKALLKKAGLENGFTVTMDTRNAEPVTSMALSIQSTFAKAGIKLEIIPGDGNVITSYSIHYTKLYEVISAVRMTIMIVCFFFIVIFPIII